MAWLLWVAGFVGGLRVGALLRAWLMVLIGWSSVANLLDSP